MQFSLVLWSIWGLVVVLFIILKIYVMGLSRDEDDQLVLQEGLSNLRTEQAVIQAKLHKVEPIQRMMMWTLIGMSLIMVAYYVVDMIQQFK